MKCLIRAVLLFSLSAPYVCSAALLSYHRFEEGTGAVALDSSGNGNAGAFFGDTVFSGDTPVAVIRETGTLNNGSIFLDGVLDAVVVPDVPVLRPFNGITLEGYFRTVSVDGGGAIVGRQYGASGIDAFRNSFALVIHGGFFTFGVTDSAGQSGTIVLPYSATVGQWYHAAGTWDGTTLRLYVDGQLIQSQAFAGTGQLGYLTSNPVLIGADDDGLGIGAVVPFEGNLDEIRIHDVALDPSAFLNAELDFGDAPSTYRTSQSENGPRHANLGPFLGASRDLEADGVPGSGAQGDDVTGSADEDGVTFSPVLGFDKNVGVSNAMMLTISNGPADYEIWVDWNTNGVFDVPDELVSSGTLSSGTHNVSISVPATASVGASYARVRVYADGAGLGSPVGFSASGEVEDYQIAITETTLVDILSFSAESTGSGSVRVTWETGSELNSAGFNLYRSEEPLGERGSYQLRMINSQLISAQGNSVEGAYYEFLDKSGYGRFLYRLEELELDGTKEWYRALVVETVPELSVVLNPSGRLELSYATIPGWDYEIQVSDAGPIESLQWEPLPMSSSSDGTASVEVLRVSDRAFFRVQATKQGLD